MVLDFIDSTTYSVSTSIEIDHSYHFVEIIFDPKSPNLAELYKPWKRCLAIIDHCVYSIYSDQIKAYFKAHEIAATIQPAYIPEDRKSVATLLEICTWITDFDLLRREPVLVIGGGLVTDVVGFACAIYRRTSRYIRIPTTLIGLIDASISNRVAVNWNGLKNRLGGYHEPLHTIIDPTFLKTLPAAEIRNGIAEILKISSCTHIATFEALEQHGEAFIKNCFGQMAGEVLEEVWGAHKRAMKGWPRRGFGVEVDIAIRPLQLSS